MFETVLLPQLHRHSGQWYLGPTFTGSALMKADADLITAGLLLDLKTSTSWEDCAVSLLSAVMCPGHPGSSGIGGDGTGSLVYGTGVPILFPREKLHQLAPPRGEVLCFAAARPADRRPGREGDCRHAIAAAVIPLNKFGDSTGLAIAAEGPLPGHPSHAANSPGPSAATATARTGGHPRSQPAGRAKPVMRYRMPRQPAP